jgi:hypothetical protein
MNGRSPESSNPYASYAMGIITRDLTERMKAEADRQYEAQRKQAELDAPRLKAKFDAAAQKYRTCLFEYVRVLALASTEPAEIVSQAAFAACREERKMVSENDMIMEAADRILTGNLLLEVLKVRATPRSPSNTASIAD